MADFGILEIAEIVSAVSAAGSLAMNAFGSKSSFQMPDISQFQIPQATLDALNQQVDQNSQIGTAANAAAKQAIQQYSAGQLSSAYQGQYNQQYQQQLESVKSQLAAQGFDQNSSQYQSAMENFQTWSASLYSGMLQQQLTGALSESGIDQAAVANINSIIANESNINAANNQAKLGTGQLQVDQNMVNTQKNTATGQSMGNLSSTLANKNVTSSVSKLFGSGNSGGGSAFQSGSGSVFASPSED